MKTLRPGDLVTLDRLGACKVTRVLPLGTVEVVARTGRHYRVSGLPLQPREPTATGSALLAVLS